MGLSRLPGLLAQLSEHHAEAKRATFTVFALEMNRTAVPLHDSLDQIQSQSRAIDSVGFISPDAVEGLKQPLLLIFRDAIAAVDDLQHGEIAIALKAGFDF